jgi:hypothetical protein
MNSFAPCVTIWTFFKISQKFLISNFVKERLALLFTATHTLCKLSKILSNVQFLICRIVVISKVAIHFQTVLPQSTQFVIPAVMYSFFPVINSTFNYSLWRHLHTSHSHFLLLYFNFSIDHKVCLFSLLNKIDGRRFRAHFVSHCTAVSPVFADAWLKYLFTWDTYSVLKEWDRYNIFISL